MMRWEKMKRYLVLLLACLSFASICSLCTSAAENDIIKNNQSGIPDKGLYRAVQDALGKKRNQTFTQEEAKSLKKLEIPFRYKIGIKSLKGIEYLSNLETLNISGYKLKSLKGIEKLPKLKILWAEGNNLKDLKSISKAKSLRSICVESNKLKSLKGIENLTNLRAVCVSYNQLTSLKELKNLKNLIEIEAHENRLKNLAGLEKLNELVRLEVSHNQIKELKPIKKLRKLGTLDVSYNQIKSLEGLKCTSSLYNLDASFNKIKKLPNLSKNEEIKYGSCRVILNCLDEEEIRSKLPKRFFREGKGRRRWLKKQLYYQNVADTIEFTIPVDGKIGKDTTKIVGKAHPRAGIYLVNQAKNAFIEANTDENGIFTMDGLDFSTWVGDTVYFEYTDYDLSEAVQFPHFVIAQ